MNAKEQDEFDRIFDQALASYSNAAPRIGLERRVLNRVLVEERRRRSRRLVFALVAAAALVVATVAISDDPDGPKPERTATTTPTPAISQPPSLGAINALASASRTPSRPVKALVKKQFFPSPVPLTSEERALLAFAKEHREPDRNALADTVKEDEPIEIPMIEIPPLGSDGGQ